MNDIPASHSPSCQCTTQPATAELDGAPSVNGGWHVRVTMLDHATGRDLVLAHTRHELEEEAQLATEWFPPIDHYSAFALQVMRGTECVQRHSICGLAFASKLGRPLESFIENGRLRGRRTVFSRSGEIEGRTLQ